MDLTDATRVARQLDRVLPAEERADLMANLASTGDDALEAFATASAVQREFEEADRAEAPRLDPPSTRLPHEAPPTSPPS